MARLIQNRRCVVCGKNNVYLWTIDNMQKVVVTYLCKEHSAPLFEIMDAAGDLAPNDQVPVPDRGDHLGSLDVHKRGRREPKMTPLDWIPPTPAELHAPPGAPELTDLDLIVLQFREEGMSWEGVGQALDISGQAAYDRFKHLPVQSQDDPS